MLYTKMVSISQSNVMSYRYCSYLSKLCLWDISLKNHPSAIYILSVTSAQAKPNQSIPVFRLLVQTLSTTVNVLDQTY